MRLRSPAVLSSFPSPVPPRESLSSHSDALVGSEEAVVDALLERVCVDGSREVVLVEISTVSLWACGQPDLSSGLEVLQNSRHAEFSAALPDGTRPRSTSRRTQENCLKCPAPPRPRSLIEGEIHLEHLSTVRLVILVIAPRTLEVVRLRLIDGMLRSRETGFASSRRLPERQMIWEGRVRLAGPRRHDERMPVLSLATASTTRLIAVVV